MVMLAFSSTMRAITGGSVLRFHEPGQRSGCTGGVAGGIAARDQGGDVARPAQHALLLGSACRGPQPPVQVPLRQ